MLEIEELIEHLKHAKSVCNCTCCQLFTQDAADLIEGYRYYLKQIGSKLRNGDAPDKIKRRIGLYHADLADEALRLRPKGLIMPREITVEDL